MFTPAIAASRGSAPFASISCARATPRRPFADAMTVGRDAPADDASGVAPAVPTRPSDRPAAAAAPVSRKRRRDTELMRRLMKVTSGICGPAPARATHSCHRAYTLRLATGMARPVASTDHVDCPGRPAARVLVLQRVSAGESLASLAPDARAHPRGG